MTYAQFHSLFDLICDKAGAPWFSATEKDLWLNLAQDEYVREQHKVFEKDAKARANVDVLVNSYTHTYITNPNPQTITLNSIVSDYLYTLSLSGVFYIADCNANITQTTIAIPPRSLDAHARNQTNTFLKPTDEEPYYIEYSNSTYDRILQVFCDSWARQITLYYMRQPAAIDGTNNPSTSSKFPSTVCNDIVYAGVRKATESVESPRYQTLSMEQIQHLQQSVQ